MSSVRNIYRRCYVESSNELEAPAAEEMLRACHMQQRTVQFSDVPWKWRW